MQTNTAYPPVRSGSRGARPPDREHVPRRGERAAPDLHFPTGRPLAQALGYPADLLARLPAQAVNSFAGLGYHLGLARLLQGERVLDLGSGSGMDVFAAATQVGPAGAVTGVDITPEQLAKAERLRRGQHARFLRARIEELPFDDGSFDAVIPNGVVNLSADKRRVFAEAARVLRPGGRLALADIVTEREIATPTARQAELWAACIAGASQRDRYLERHRGRRPPAAGGPGQSRLPIRERTSAAHEPQVRRAQRVAARAQARVWIPTYQPNNHRGDLQVSTVTDTIRNGLETEKLTIRVAAKTSLPPERVLDAGRDFSERRADVWSNVKVKHLEVHELGETFAEVTEGTWVVGLFWERCRYDWSQPGLVKATVIDSSVFEPGSTWELRATPCDRRERSRDRATSRVPPWAEGEDRQRGPPHSRQVGVGLVPSSCPRRSREAGCLTTSVPLVKSLRLR